MICIRESHLFDSYNFCYTGTTLLSFAEIGKKAQIQFRFIQGIEQLAS